MVKHELLLLQNPVRNGFHLIRRDPLTRMVPKPFTSEPIRSHASSLSEPASQSARHPPRLRNHQRRETPNFPRKQLCLSPIRRRPCLHVMEFLDFSPNSIMSASIARVLEAVPRGPTLQAAPNRLRIRIVAVAYERPVSRQREYFHPPLGRHEFAQDFAATSAKDTPMDQTAAAAPGHWQRCGGRR